MGVDRGAEEEEASGLVVERRCVDDLCFDDPCIAVGIALGSISSEQLFAVQEAGPGV